MDGFLVTLEISACEDVYLLSKVPKKLVLFCILFYIIYVLHLATQWFLLQAIEERRRQKDAQEQIRRQQKELKQAERDEKLKRDEEEKRLKREAREKEEEERKEKRRREDIEKKAQREAKEREIAEKAKVGVHVLFSIRNACTDI